MNTTTERPIDFSEILAELAKLPAETPQETADRERRRMESERADRLRSFRNICPSEFMQTVDRTKLANSVAFDLVAAWDGSFPGPLATGATGTRKTGAAWSAIGRLNVQQGYSVAWFPVKRLITEFTRYESKDLADEFWRMYEKFDILFVDDLDKFNHQFESEGAAVFAFYDWIYREHLPCITTTNKPREWWANLMGDAFARRLFDDAHRPVQF
jgi:DNA replication protein DnaC